MKDPWILTIASDLKEYGMGEDEMLYCEVYYKLVTNEAGYRFIGPTLGNSRDNSDKVNDWKNSWPVRMPFDFDPETHPDWQPTFPVYGSTAYCQSGQQQADVYAEKNDIPYFPV